MSESMVSEEENAQKEIEFEFLVPIDIRQVASIEVFGEQCPIYEADDRKESKTPLQATEY